MNKILISLLMISTYALASGGEHAETDIVQRTVNFLLFAGVVWYLIAEPMKAYFASRSDSIANELKKVQDRLRDSAALKKDALAKVANAEKFSEELAASSKKENKLLNDHIASQCDADLENISKQQSVLMEFEQRKMVRGVVESVLKDVLTQSDASFDKDAMAKIIFKKVA